MKRILIAFLSALLLLTSCHKAIWDKLDDHEKRIARLEQLCNQLNTNISALQAIVDVINARDYVKDVLPILEDGKEIGYTITFNGHNPVTIFNGKDGVDGKDGKDGENGHTPMIGIRKDFDGIWYWTLDGEWVLDENGSKVRADGSGNGRDGITPILKIEDEYWWVSYDNGSNWTRLEKAVGEKGADGDSMFAEIRQDEHYVYLILTNGEELRLSKGGLTWVYV